MARLAHAFLLPLAASARTLRGFGGAMRTMDARQAREGQGLHATRREAGGQT